MLSSVIGNLKIAKFIPVSVKFVPFNAILCSCGMVNRIFGSFTGLQDETSTFYSCDISFSNFVCIACNVPCIRVLVRLRYVSSFPDTFQPYRGQMSDGVVPASVLVTASIRRQQASNASKPEYQF